jgi:hypothetical protein
MCSEDVLLDAPPHKSKNAGGRGLTEPTHTGESETIIAGQEPSTRQVTFSTLQSANSGNQHYTSSYIALLKL